MFLCIFFLFDYIFLEFVSIAGPQAQTQFFTQHSAAGFLWEEHINTSDWDQRMSWICWWTESKHGCVDDWAWLSEGVSVFWCSTAYVKINGLLLTSTGSTDFISFFLTVFRETGFCFWSDRCVFALAHTFCSMALLRLLEVSSRTATNVPSPRPRERTRNIPLRLCGCTAKDLALSVRQLLAHHLLRR